MNRRPRRKLLSASLLLIAMAGCGSPDGPERAAVEGTVSFDGEPVPEGTIKFIPAEGTKGPSAGGTIEAGRFMIAAIKGPVVGRQKVSIIGLRKTGRIYDALPPKKIMWEETAPYIPEKFNAKTELIVDVNSGENRFDLDLKSQE